MAAAKPLAPNTVLTSDIGQYTVIRVLGSGGFGITYQVETKVKIHNITLTIKLAVKEHFISSLCWRDTNTQQISFSEPVEETVIKSRRAFVKEARRLQSLGVEHPNIVRINEVFEANNTAYYVMEYLDGETLQEYVKRRGALSYAETLEVMHPIVDAVKTLHLNNIAHYDIKPGNIILAHTDDGSLRPVLIDFGLSKHYDEDGDPTSTLDSGGYSPGYASIEQHAGLSTYNPQSDVYALAATMYYCLVGKKPPIAHEFDVKTLPSLLGAKAPAEFITTLQQAMAYSKMDRIPNACEFYDRVYKNQATNTTTPEHTLIYDNEETRIDPNRCEDITHLPALADETNIFPLKVSPIKDCFLAGRSSENSAQYPPEEEVIAAARQRYNVVGTFKEGMAIVGKDGKFGFIDYNGKEVVAPIYAAAYCFSEGVATVAIVDRLCNRKTGFIDITGNEIIPCMYEDANSFSDGVAKVLKNGKCGFIDHQGNEVVPFGKYDDAMDFSNGLAIVAKDDKYGFIDRYGKVIIPLIYNYAENFSEGLARVRIGDWETGKWGFIDRKGNEIVEPKYDAVESFSEGLAVVEKNGNFGFIDRKGEVVIPLEYNYAGAFSEGLAEVEKEGKWGFIDKIGNEVIPLKYDYALSFSEGLIAVRIGDSETGKWGFIDKIGNEVVAPKYDDVYSFSDGLAMVRIGDWETNKYGFINRNDEVVIPLEYDFIEPFSEGLARVEKDGKYGYIDTAGNVMWMPEE